MWLKFYTLNFHKGKLLVLRFFACRQQAGSGEELKAIMTLR